jgi:AbrB family looped-hinge helix DNA binding protein
MKTARATLTSKGQVTIPKDVRDSMQVSTGDAVEFLVRDDGVVELRRRPPLGDGLFARFAAYAVAEPGTARNASIEHAFERDRSTRE